MSSRQFLRGLINERLTAAAEEIFTHVENIIVQYEKEVDRQRELLEVVCQPQVKLQRIELPQQRVYNEDEEEVLSEQQLCNQQRHSRLDQEEPESLQIKEEEEEICTSQEQLELKQEADTIMLTPDDEESDHTEPEPPPIFKSQDQTGSKHLERTIVGYEEEVERGVWKPDVKSQQIELPQQQVFIEEEEEEEEVLTEQQLWNQERNSGLECLQIKEEEESGSFTGAETFARQQPLEQSVKWVSVHRVLSVRRTRFSMTRSSGTRRETPVWTKRNHRLKRNRNQVKDLMNLINKYKDMIII
ncbi:golgin subfamily A member 6-like protein 22 isoform X4 [Solea solea]|uniref:golgin subfamily A member 6-like protein 22 isoform X4 n=1 Tax=Solea solea TaxID=90069 RepID=UPI00272BB1C4|nr:golgin subfamily A member 6-like protein 22 isoform X4 [Solea solea]